MRVTNNRLINNMAARALLKARAQYVDSLKGLSIVAPRCLVESRSLIEMPLSESVMGRVGAETIEMWPHLFSFTFEVVKVRSCRSQLNVISKKKRDFLKGIRKVIHVYQE